MSNVDNFTVQLSYLKIINRLRFRTFFSVFLQSGAFVFKRCLLSLSLRLSKSEEDKDELKATLSSLKKEGCKINRTLKEERNQTERQTRKLGEAQNEVGRLHKEVAQLHSTVNNLESQVISLNFEKTDLEDDNVKQQLHIKLQGRIINKN
ncbi:uncharacterized protein LOC110042793 [Orbicella faveolata]|uniref:uncharacterized protein LOC110042793 n=1 Tax=Orbicella faveolata TaxID=48498 RepID=UPI0009E3BEE1|nr:uncharacterized protein LOC110042793 [Orbicella faveolata]